MRHTLTTVVLIVLLFPAIVVGETVKREDLTKRDGLFYKKFTDVPFSGEVNYGVRKREAYKDGKKNRTWVEY